MMRPALALALLLCACGDKPGPAGPAAPRDLGEALERASPSVYLVLMQTGSGAAMTEAPLATAFVVAPDRLATNAHVAETFDALGVGGRLVVRSSGTAPRDAVVTGAEIHPGYVEFQRAWLDQLPIRRGPKGEAMAIPPLAAADVALLKVGADAGLAPPLQLASAEELAGLAGGRAVGLIGFPMENVMLGGVDPARPVPQVRMGIVTAVTDFLFGAAAPGECQLVHHSLQVSGGASGSPVIAADGKVIGILSAGNLVQVEGVGRIDSGAGMGYAQRIDLLRELLNGDASRLQDARLERWREGIKRFPSGREELEKAIAPLLEPVVARWERENGVKARRIQAEVGFLSPASAFDRQMGQPGAFACEHWQKTDAGEILHPSGARYLVVVVAHGQEDLDLYVRRIEHRSGDSPTVSLGGRPFRVPDIRWVPVGSDTSMGPVSAVSYTVPDLGEPGKVLIDHKARVVGPSNGVAYSFYVYGGGS